MSKRITKADLRAKAEHINRIAGLDVEIGYAYGRPRAHLNKGSKDLSPRLPSGQLWDWLNAFETGIEYGLTKSKRVW